MTSGHCRPVKQLLHQLFGGFRISLPLNEEVQNFAFIVHGAPEPIALPLDDDHHLIKVPVIAGPGSGAAQVSRDDGSKLQDPAANGLLGDVQTSFGEHLLHIAETQSESGIQPDRMADNFRWKAVTLEGKLAHRDSLMLVAPPCHSSLCDKACANALCGLASA